jgi:hypothetical protein
MRTVSKVLNVAAPTAAQGSSLVLLQAQTASASATIDFTTNITSTYDEYEIHLVNVRPATDDTDLWLRVDSNAGASFEAAATDYQWATKGVSTIGTDLDSSGAGLTSEIILNSTIATGGVTNDADNGVCGVIKMFTPASTTHYKRFMWSICFENKDAGTNVHAIINGAGAYVGATTAIDAIRFMFSSGNITSGSFYLYGVRKS